MESQANRKADATNQDDGSEQSEELRLRLEAQRFMDERMKDKIPATKKSTKEATIHEGQSVNHTGNNVDHFSLSAAAV